MKRFYQILYFLTFPLILFLVSLVLSVYLLGGTPIFAALFSSKYPYLEFSSKTETSSNSEKIYENTQKELKKLSQDLDNFTPSRPYLVVNTTKNHFYLYQSKGRLMREGFCSSGSYIKLRADNDREWLFKTPKGMRTIKGKTRSPVWRKPDWAFIEEGLPVPPPDHPSRYESGVLGDYALSLGDGYLIHGTIYKRFLGMPVTHGCIRMGDEDLELVYKTLDIGSRVYIY